MIVRQDKKEEFVSSVKDKKIVCFGIGNKFPDFLQNLSEMGLADNVCCLIDNDPKKKGTQIEIGGRYLDIKGAEEITDNIDSTAAVILITSLYWNQIVFQLNQIKELEAVNCYIGLYLFHDSSCLNYAVSESLGRLLDDSHNIGINGENLTISILMRNRAGLTVRLLDSIEEMLEGFRGKILLGDNGSEKSDLDRVKNRIEGLPFDCKIIEFDTNYGTAKGKNRLNQAAETEWILQLDNDIYFTGNPLEKIRKDIALTGCHFMSLPYYDVQSERIKNYGNGLAVSPNGNERYLSSDYGLYSGELDRESVWEPMLCTYTSGGASVFKKSTFFCCGGYDENYFVGFEDIDFSVKLFKMGFKIGNAGILNLVHDHARLDEKQDIEYDRTRFSGNILRKDAEYFEKKNRYKTFYGQKERKDPNEKQ